MFGKSKGTKVTKGTKTTNHKLWKTTVTCNGKGAWNFQDNKNACGQTIRVNENDICKRGTSYYGVICPFCGSFIEITDIPEV